MRQKSKKELAWDRERQHLQTKINVLGAEFRRQMEDILEYQEQINSLKDWNRRLLEYMDLPEEVMRKKIHYEKELAASTKAFSEIVKPISGIMALEMSVPAIIQALIKGC